MPQRSLLLRFGLASWDLTKDCLQALPDIMVVTIFAVADGFVALAPDAAQNDVLRFASTFVHKEPLGRRGGW